jgi:protease-4
MIPDIGGTIKNKLHVTVTPVKSNDHADMLGMMRPLTPNEEAYMQASVERIYTKFTSIVAEGRDMTVEAVDEIAQGRVWTGAEALEIGLVDEIGTLEDAIEYAAMSIEGVTSVSDVQVAAYPKPKTTLETLLEALTGTESAFAGTPLESVEQSFLGWDASQAGKVYARIPYEIVVR